MSHLDWSARGNQAGVGPLQPCGRCGHGAPLRHPETGRPWHKTCAELDLDEQIERNGGTS